MILFLIRPIQELSILNRNNVFRLLAAVSVCSGMIYSSDTTLIIYYMKNQINVGYQSISSMLFWSSLVGVCVQTFVLKGMIEWCGEKRILVIGLIIGAVHNLMYGIATSQWVVYSGLILSNFASIHFPVLVSIRSIQVGDDEQGHVQGAFFALAAIADAIGPIFLQSIYKSTKHTAVPGTMFVVASGVYLLGAGVACALPVEKANSSSRIEEQQQQQQHQQRENNNEISIDDDIERRLSAEPLLLAHLSSSEGELL